MPKLPQDALFALCFVALVFTLVAICSAAGAHDLNPDQCRGQARDALTFAEHRDVGVKIEAARIVVQKGLAQASVNPEGYIKDEADRARVMAMLDSVFASDTPPGRWYDMVLEACVRQYRRAGGT